MWQFLSKKEQSWAEVDSISRTSALQAQSPEFKPMFHQKKKKNKKAGSITITDFETYYRTIVTKMAQNWHKTNT
jgi:hypothetical protein